MNILYCRKSSESEDRQVLSIDSQKNELLEMATQDGLPIEKIFTESMSAKAPGRPEFEKLIQLIKKSKGCVLYTWKIDRLSRNPVDNGTISWLLQQGVIKEIRTHERRYYPTDNVLLMSVEFGMANQYLRDLSVNVKRGIRAKREMGGWVSLAPIGYLNDKVNHTIYPDPERAHYVRKLFELFATNQYGSKELTALMFARGFRTRSGKKVHESMIYRILHNTVYKGVITTADKPYLGMHTALISQALFAECQRVFSPNRSRAQRHFFPLSGCLSCADCGCAFTATKARGHVYYYCTNKRNICLQHKTYLKSRVADTLISGVLGYLQFDPELVEIMYQAAKEKTGTAKSESQILHDNILQRQNLLSQKRLRLEDAYLDGSLSKERYDAKTKEYESEDISLKNELKHSKPVDPDVKFEQTKKAFLTGLTAQTDYLDGDDQHKREVVKNLCSNISIRNNIVQSYQLKQPFQLIADMPKNSDFSKWLGLVV